MSQNYFSHYEKQRRTTKRFLDKKIVRNVGKPIYDQVSVDDLELIALISEGIESGEMNWPAIEKRITGSSLVKSLLEKGVDKKWVEGWVEFCKMTVDTGIQFHQFFKALELKTLVATQKEHIKNEIERMSLGLEVKANELKEKVKKIGKGAETPVTDVLAEFIKIAKEVKKLANAGHSLRAEVSLMVDLDKSALDFPYWLSRQLAKRRLFQNELEHIAVLKKNLNILSEHEIKVSLFLNGKQDDTLKKLFGVTTLGSIKKMSLKEYRKALQDKLNELLAIVSKPEFERSAIEIEKLNNNHVLLSFLFDRKGGALNQELLSAFTMQLEVEKIDRLIARREELIQHRVIAETELNKIAEINKTKSGDQEGAKAARDANDTIQHILSDSLETKVPDFISVSERSKVESFLKFSHNVALADPTSNQIRASLEFNKQYEKKLHDKIGSEQKKVKARGLLLISAAFGFTTAVCGAITVLCPIAAPVTVPLGLVSAGMAGIFGFAAEHVQPGVTKDVYKKNLGHFSSRIKKQKHINKKIKKMRSESEGMDVASLLQSQTVQASVSSASQQQTALQQNSAPLLSAGLGTDFAKVVIESEQKNYFLSYNVGRVVVPEDQAGKILESILKTVSPEDAILITQAIEGEADWAAIAQRVVLSDGAKKAFKELGVEPKAYEEFVMGLSELGAKIQKLFRDIKVKALNKEQKDKVMGDISNMSKGLEVNVDNLKKQVDELGKKPDMPVTEHVKNAVKIFRALQQMAFSIHALRADVHAYHNVVRNQDNFEYWLDRQLAKRQLLLDELKSIRKASKNLTVDTKDQEWMNGLKSDQLATMQQNLFGTLLLAEIQKLNTSAYRKLLEEKLNHLVAVLAKKEKSPDDLELLHVNREWVVHLYDRTNNKAKADMVVALAAHFEKERVMDTLHHQELRIENRVLAQLTNRDQEVDFCARVRATMDKSVEKVVPRFIKSTSDQHKAQEFLNFSQNIDAKLSDINRVNKALHEESRFLIGVEKKLHVREKRILGKSFILSGAGLALAAVVCVSLVALANPLGIAALALMAVSAACMFAANRAQPGVLVEMKNSFTHFSQKIVKHDRIKFTTKKIEEKIDSRATKKQAPQLGVAKPVVDVSLSVPAPVAAPQRSPVLQTSMDDVDNNVRRPGNNRK